MKFLKQVTEAAEALLKMIRDAGIAPNMNKRLDRRFNASEAAKLSGRSVSHTLRTIQDLEAEGKCPPFTEDGRFKYEMEHIHSLRDRFDTGPNRNPLIDDPMVLAVQNFKGGVGKTTLALNLAEHLVIKGYKVLLIDMDSQASATASFGYIPDSDIEEGETILPFFDGFKDDLKYCVRETHWPGLDLIPTNLSSFSMEWGMAAEVLQNPKDKDYWVSRLADGIATVSDAYDVVIIDSPPSLGVTSMNILRAVNGLVIPSPAKALDFASTVQYFRLLNRMIEGMDIDPDAIKFAAIVNTLYEGRDMGSKDAREKSDGPVAPNMQLQIRLLMEEVFGAAGFLIDPPFKKLADIENAASSYSTVLEERRPKKETAEMIHAVCAHIELRILRTWPSKAMAAADLEKELGVEPPCEEIDDGEEH